MTRERRATFSVRFTTAERRAVGARAAAHRTSVAGFMRAVALGHRPGAGPGTTAADADAWWDGLPPARRAQVHSFLATTRTTPAVYAGQDALPLEEGAP